MLLCFIFYLFSFAAIKEARQLLEVEPFKSNKLLYPFIFAFSICRIRTLYLRTDVLLHTECIFEEITHYAVKRKFFLELYIKNICT